ncbi:hypothetical protein [Nitrosopumilus adriaticus]|uniref:Uncharacterized protein n=1 Tax=Nitrosopumilus adriaticus TaxID=1580092 RepID=A0A0D5C2U3_9ARCH|nr:hypothetical protein [Nitrosopumilus adriaticus]AJW71036.1 hypothetical protein NADRNF5_1350 [Nitrosopumilus adriaticus]
MDYIENAIYKEIKKHNSLRWGELKKLVVPKTCSDRPFRETLKRMVKNKIVVRTQVDKQNVHYATKSSKLSESLIAFLSDYELKKLEEHLNLYDKKNIKLNALQRANSFSSFMKVIGGIELFWKEFFEQFPSIKNKQFEKKFEKLKDRFYELYLTDESKPDEWSEIFASIYSNESSVWYKEIQKTLK